MKYKDIKDLSIVKAPYTNRAKIMSGLSRGKWIDFIERNQGYITWLENTEKGMQTLSNLNAVPESFRETVVKGHAKTRVSRCFIAEQWHTNNRQELPGKRKVIFHSLNAEIY